MISSTVTSRRATSRGGSYGRFAGWSATVASRAPVGAFCLFLALAWLVQAAITIVVTGGLTTLLDARYQLDTGATTTVITFLLVALLRSSCRRDDGAGATPPA